MSILKISEMARIVICLVVFIGELQSQLVHQNALNFEKAEIIFEDNFDSENKNWIFETKQSQNSKILINEGKLIIDVDRGATVWLNKKIEGNVLFEYKRKVVVKGGGNDRLSDLNQFWMAKDPKSIHFFTRTGDFSQYDSLMLYYFGIGGNTNTTTRFRKYLGNGNRFLITDLQRPKYLLAPNKTYVITTVLYDGVTEVYVDGDLFFSFKDSAPYKRGFFGFRTTESNHEIDDFKIYRLKQKK